MSVETEYRFYYQSSSHGWINLTKPQADELIAILDEVATSGRTIVWSVHDTHNEYWDTVIRFLIGPGIPVRLEVMNQTSPHE